MRVWSNLNLEQNRNFRAQKCLRIIKLITCILNKKKTIRLFCLFTRRLLHYTLKGIFIVTCEQPQGNYNEICEEIRVTQK